MLSISNNFPPFKLGKAVFVENQMVRTLLFVKFVLGEWWLLGRG